MKLASQLHSSGFSHSVWQFSQFSSTNVLTSTKMLWEGSADGNRKKPVVHMCTCCDFMPI